MWFEAQPGRCLFQPDDRCRFLIRDGGEVLFDIQEPATVERAALHFTQCILGILLHQRGLAPLHGSAVRLDDRGIVLLGDSGTGKSTLAAWFHATVPRAVFLTDDVCPITREVPPRIAGGSPYLKLDPGVHSGLGLKGTTRDIPCEGNRIRQLALLAEHPPEPVRLHQIYVLRPDRTCAVPTLRKLRHPETLEALLNNTFRRCYLIALGLWQQQFPLFARIAAAAPIWELRWHPDRVPLDQVGELLLESCRHTACGPVQSPAPARTSW